MHNPDLSIVIPCFDEGHYLAEAVQSVLGQEAILAQSLPAFEILIINDHTTDEATLAALEQLNELDSRIQILLNNGKRGPGGARNTGITAARGKWIAFLDADDRWLKNAIDVRWAVLRDYPQAAWISADYRYFRESGEKGQEHIEDSFFRSRPKPSAMLREAFARGRVLRLEKPVTQFLESSLACTDTVMAKRSLLIRLGSFDESLIRAQDTHLWLKLANETDFFFVPDIIAEYRQRETTRTNRGYPPGKWEIVALKQLLAEPAFRKHYGNIRQRVARRLVEDLNFYRASGERSKGLELFSETLRYVPFRWAVWKTGIALIAGRE
jgi:glycosyltransferase involved in cell wall biosynthesis